jgi:hypothetical protein
MTCQVLSAEQLLATGMPLRRHLYAPESLSGARLYKLIALSTPS